MASDTRRPPVSAGPEDSLLPRSCAVPPRTPQRGKAIPIREDKDALRQRAAEARAAIDPATRQSAALAIEELVFNTFDLKQECRGEALCAFWPVAHEIDCRQILSRASGEGIEIGLPVVVRRYEPLIFRRWRPEDELEAGPHNTQHPRPDAPQVTPRVMLVPMLSFTRAGFRLGYGGGYFDQTLEVLRKNGPILAIGLAFSAQEVEKLPLEPHDQPLDWVVTEKEAIDCRTAA